MRVMLATTVPCSCTAASAPVVLYETTVCLPSFQVASAVPAVVLLPQLPLPCGMGSW